MENSPTSLAPQKVNLRENLYTVKVACPRTVIQWQVRGGGHLGPEECGLLWPQGDWVHFRIPQIRKTYAWRRAMHLAYDKPGFQKCCHILLEPKSQGSILWHYLCVTVTCTCN